MFYRSYDVGTDNMYTDMTSPATVSDFRLDTYEVTVGRFRQFVDAGMGTQASPPSSGAGAHPNIADSGWDPSWNGILVADTPALNVEAIDCATPYQTWTNTPSANENRPMNCITWYEAMAFCTWDRGFLPTEAEWNYAATGGSEQRAYPWSSPPGLLGIDGTRASYGDSLGNCYGAGTTLHPCTVTDLMVVGTKQAGDGRWGQSDLAGNVWEWTLDWYASPYATPCTDCASLTPGSYRVSRGGDFSSEEAALRTANRANVTPPTRDYSTGVRCARSAP